MMTTGTMMMTTAGRAMAITMAIRTETAITTGTIMETTMETETTITRRKKAAGSM